MRLEHEICSTICGHVEDLYWTMKIWLGWQGGSGNEKSAKDPKNGPYLSGPPNCLWLIWVLSGVLDPFGGPSRALKPNWGHFLGRFWPSLSPPANQVRFLWSKMGRTHVPHKVLHISSWTRTYWGHLRPSEVIFWSFWANKANIPPFPHFRGDRQLGNGWVKW